MKKLFFPVILMAFVLVAFESNAQLLPTKLQVIVRNDLGNVVEGATVTLYKTEADYDGDKNPVKSGKTDKKGRIIFEDLQPIAYFMNVTMGELSNAGRGVQTTKLIVKKKNIVNVVIE